MEAMGVLSMRWPGRIFPLLLAGIALCAAPLRAGDMVKYRTPQVRLYTDIGKKEAAKVMEDITFFSEYIDGFFRGYKITPRKKNPIRCRLFEDVHEFEEFRRKENVLRYAGAYFSSHNNCIVAPYGGGGPGALCTLRHECAHQVIKRYINDPQTWLDEGLACYFEGVVFDPHRNVVTTCHRTRLGAMHNLLARGRLMEWKRFLEMTRSVYDQRVREGAIDVGAFYTQSWGVVFFYIESTDEAVRNVWQRFLRGMHTGREQPKLILQDIRRREDELRAFFQEDHLKVYRLYTKARAALERGQGEQALALLVDLLGIAPRHTAALRLAADVAWDLKCWPDALELYRLLAEKKPKEPLFRWRICRCLTEEARARNDTALMGEAVAAGEEAVRLTRSQEPHCLAALAMAYHAQGRVRTALNMMRRATRFTRCEAYEEYKQLERAYSKEVIERGIK